MLNASINRTIKDLLDFCRIGATMSMSERIAQIVSRTAAADKIGSCQPVQFAAESAVLVQAAGSFLFSRISFPCFVDLVVITSLTILANFPELETRSAIYQLYQSLLSNHHLSRRLGNQQPGLVYNANTISCSVGFALLR